MPPRIAVIAGTRPEFVKLAPIVEELRLRGVEPTIVQTGQHVSLLRGTPAESTMAPQVNLNLPSNNDPLEYARACRKRLGEYWGAAPWPDLIMVQGDTASAYAGAMAAQGKVPVVHVEAGIRSCVPDDPWPEERFRTEIDLIAEWRFCPTIQNAGHVAHGFWDGAAWKDAKVAVTGNSGIDALYSHTKPAKEVEDRVLITLHRRESFGEALYQITCGIDQAARRHQNITFVWPMHPNPEVLKATVWVFATDGAAVHGPENLIDVDPMEPVKFAQFLSRCRAVITDSGGVQEEAAALGIPCIVAREKTDRPESVEIGLAKVVGRTEQGILDGLDWALGFAKRPDPSQCFGDGKAAPRIVQHLLGCL